jgi:hypothetical protein
MRELLPKSIGLALLAAALGACAQTSVTQLNLLPRVDQLARPDWMTYSGSKDHFTLRAVTAADLVTADGRCPAEAARAQDADPSQEPPLVQGGIALQMTECDVVRRAGAPEQLQIGADERGGRAVVITYVRGPRPGIYRFAGGRLQTIERAPSAPAERPQKGKAKKSARN